MARNGFSTSNYFAVNAVPFTGAPASMACRFNSDNNSAAQNMLAITDNASSSQDEIELQLRGDVASDPVRAAKAQTGVFVSAEKTTYSINAWQSAGGRFGSATSMFAYLEGVAGTEQTSSSTPSGVSWTAIGVAKRPTPGAAMSGALAEAGFWSEALTSSEFLALAHGCSPMLVRPTHLEAYFPLFSGYSTGGEPNWHGSSELNLAETGTVGNAAHPNAVAYPVP